VTNEQMHDAPAWNGIGIDLQSAGAASCSRHRLSGVHPGPYPFLFPFRRATRGRGGGGGGVGLEQRQ